MAATGQDVRITDVPYTSTPADSTLVFINDGGKLRQTDFTTIVQQSKLYTTITEAHQAALDEVGALLNTGTTDLQTALDSSLSTLREAKEELHQELEEYVEGVVGGLDEYMSNTEKATNALGFDSTDTAFENLLPALSGIDGWAATYITASGSGTVGRSLRQIIVDGEWNGTNFSNGVSWRPVFPSGPIDHLSIGAYGGSLATEKEEFYFSRLDGTYITLPAGTYALSGCPKDGTVHKRWIEVGTNVGGEYVCLAKDTGDGVTFTLEEDTPIELKLVVMGANFLFVFTPVLQAVQHILHKASVALHKAGTSPTIRIGTIAPNNTMGCDGDIYVRVILNEEGGVIDNVYL